MLIGGYTPPKKKYYTISSYTGSTKRTKRRPEAGNVQCQGSSINQPTNNSADYSNIYNDKFSKNVSLQIFLLILFSMLCVIAATIAGIWYYQKRKESSRKLW